MPKSNAGYAVGVAGCWHPKLRAVVMAVALGGTYVLRGGMIASLPGRADPVALLAAQGKARLPELLPLRYQRMRAGAFAFYRGAAAIMAADLGREAAEGPMVQLSGDAHLANFGSYASPEGAPVFDLNDFDETLPGPFAWDVKRLATSLYISGAEGGLGRRDCRALAARAARHYRKHMAKLAGMAPLEAWHSTIDLRAAIADIDHAKLRKRLEKRLAHAMAASAIHYSLIDASTTPPTLKEQEASQHLPAYTSTIDKALAAYPASLQPHVQDLLGRYRLVDRAFKVVGVGSVGTFCAVGLYVSDNGAPLLLQLKEAQASVLAAHLPAPQRWAHQGERVVVGQRRLQAQSDIFLGWTKGRVGGRDFYVRRLKDSRLAQIGAAIETDMLPFTAGLCGRTLARAHGRTGDAGALCAAMADSAFDGQMADFAESYAVQNQADYAQFCAALDSGRLG